jgi:quercetin dioxygenase-like cupin family protein
MMDATVYRWSEVEEEKPIALLTRRKVTGDQMLLAKIHLAKGCKVDLHSHESEQMGVVLSGHLRWTLGGDSPRTVDIRGGETIHLPANVPHGVEALEDSDVIDVLSPVGPMGVDSQKS